MTNNCDCPKCVLVQNKTNICGFLVETDPKIAKNCVPCPSLSEEERDALIGMVVIAEKKYKRWKRGDVVADETDEYHYNVECLMCSGKRRLFKVCFHAHEEEDEVAEDPLPAKTD